MKYIVCSMQHDNKEIVCEKVEAKSRDEALSAADNGAHAFEVIAKRTFSESRFMNHPFRVETKKDITLFSNLQDSVSRLSSVGPDEVISADSVTSCEYMRKEYPPLSYVVMCNEMTVGDNLPTKESALSCAYKAKADNLRYPVTVYQRDESGYVVKSVCTI